MVTPLATGRVESLALNGKTVDTIHFGALGPYGDDHSGFTRTLSGHDTYYRAITGLPKGRQIINFRTWTALSLEERCLTEEELGVTIPDGCLLENMVISGIHWLSKVTPGSVLVFPHQRPEQLDVCSLGIWEENGPCSTVGDRVAEYHGRPELAKAFVSAARNKRGVMGYTITPGTVHVGDEVQLFPPAR